MAFGSSIRDGDGTIPISQGYKPGTGFVALQSSAITFTDASSNKAAGVVMSRAVHEAGMNGQVYTATTGVVALTTQVNIPFSLFHAGTNTTNILIFSIITIGYGTGGPVQVNANTSNQSWGTSITPSNLSLGAGPATSLAAGAVTTTTTTQTLPATAILAATRLATNTKEELLLNDKPIFIAGGQGQGITVWWTPAATGNSFLLALNWVEF